MSQKIKYLLAVVVVALVAYLILTHSSQNLVGQASGSGTPTVYDNVNLLGEMQVGVTAGNPTIFSPYGAGTIWASGAIVSSSTIYAQAGLTQGGVQTLATSSSGTLTPTQISSSLLVVNVSTGTGAITLTLPATSTLASFVPNVGDVQQLVIYNASTTHAGITLAGSTGVTLQAPINASTSKAIAGGDTAILEFIRVSSGSVVTTMYQSH